MSPLKHGTGIVVVGGLVAVLGWAGALAQDAPGPPSFAYAYGRVLVNGENLAPEVQPVIAFVNGKSCGGAPVSTFVATPGDDVPDEDVGRTVYVIDVLADGTNTYERPGCGRSGDPIMLYFPTIGRSSTQQPLFQPGPLRTDLELDVALQFRATLPQLSGDGTD